MSFKKKFKNTCIFYRLLSSKRGLQKTRVANRTVTEQMATVAKMYKDRIGRPLDWNHLQTYTEKMQREKLFDKNPMKVTLSDKYLVRDWVAGKIGEEDEEVFLYFENQK